MAENPTIVSLQNATKAAAEALVREKESAAAKEPPGTPPPEKKPEPKAPEPKAPEKKPEPPKKPEPQEPPDNTGDTLPKDLAAQIREKYGIELEEDEILSRLKNGNGHKDTPPVSEKGKPKKEDITDDAVAKWLAENKKPDLVAQHTANAKKDDLSLVKEYQTQLIKQQYKDVDDEEAERLFNERFYIPAEEASGEYNQEEIALGKFLLKQEAERLRGGVAWQIDGIRDMLYEEAEAQYQVQNFHKAVDEFISKQPKELVLPLGKSARIDLGDFPIKLQDETMKQIADIMRTPSILVNRFRPKLEDGSVDEDAPLDLNLMYNFLIKAELFDNAVKSAAVDYYSKGVEAVENKLHNYPNLSKAGAPEKKETKREEQQKAEDFNTKQIQENLGRGRKR